MRGSAVFRFALPGVTQDEAAQLAKEIVECFPERVKYVAAHDRNALVRAASVVFDQAISDHGGVSKRDWSRLSKATRLADYRYELRPSWRVTSTVPKTEALELAFQKKRVLRFVYPNTRGVPTTRRVEVTSITSQSFNGRRFDPDGVVQFRTYSLDKATTFQVETLSAKHLSPTVVLKVEFLANWLTISFDDPPID